MSDDQRAARRAMLQSLLADRFRLVAHWEPRDKVVYDLVRDGPLGPRLQPCAEGSQLCQNRNYSGSTVGFPGQSNFTRSHRMVGHPLGLFVGNLALDFQRPITDRTELEGPFHLELQYSLPAQAERQIRNITLPGMPGKLSAIPPNDEWRAFSQALREQLGLRLEPRTVSEDVLVIDRIALPSYD